MLSSLIKPFVKISSLLGMVSVDVKSISSYDNRHEYLVSREEYILQGSTEHNMKYIPNLLISDLLTAGVDINDDNQLVKYLQSKNVLPSIPRQKNFAGIISEGNTHLDDALHILGEIYNSFCIKSSYFADWRYTCLQTYEKLYEDASSYFKSNQIAEKIVQAVKNTTKGKMDTIICFRDITLEQIDDFYNTIN